MSVVTAISQLTLPSNWDEIVAALAAGDAERASYLFIGPLEEPASPTTFELELETVEAEAETRNNRQEW